MNKINFIKPEEAFTKTTKTPQDALKKKRSELRLYSDLLMQQVHSIKTSVKDPSLPDSSCPVDLDKLNEGCSLLSQTCDTFIHTLDETMKLANQGCICAFGSALNLQGGIKLP